MKGLSGILLVVLSCAAAVLLCSGGELFLSTSSTATSKGRNQVNPAGAQFTVQAVASYLTIGA